MNTPATCSLSYGRLLGAFRAEVREHLGLGGVDGLVAFHLVRDGISRAQVLFDQAQHLLFERRVIRRLEVARLLGGLFGEPNDRLDHRLEVPVAEHHGAEHDFFAQFLGFRFDHQNGVLRAGDDEIKLAFRPSRRLAD